MSCNKHGKFTDTDGERQAFIALHNHRKVSRKVLLLQELRKYLLLVSDKTKVSTYRSRLHNEAGLSVNKQTVNTESEVSLKDLLVIATFIQFRSL